MQTTEKKTNHIFVAFPGMGKTTYALSHSGVVDLDFGNLRSALGVPKNQQHTLYPKYQNLAKYYFKDGYDVLTNDQGLIPFLKQFAEGKIIMVLPKDKTEHVQRVEERERKRHVNAEFPRMLRDNIDTWVDDWAKVAKRYNVPVYYVQYFEEVADENRKI